MSEENYIWEWHRLRLANQLANVDGDAFENLFQILAKARWGVSFIPTIPMGSRGDLKCDGYRSDIGCVYQCYGPRYGQVNVNDALDKIDTDFTGAKDHWKSELKKWVFVLGVYKNKVPSELIKKAADVSVILSTPYEIMTRDDIIAFSRDISDNDRNSILGSAPTPGDLVRKVTYQNIGRALAFIRAEVERSPVEKIALPPDVDKKIKHNLLSNSARMFIEVGQTASAKVQSYLLTYVDPGEAEEMAEGFSKRYKEVMSGGAEPSQAFREMIIFAGGATGDPERDSAALAVVAHFFATCEIFEQPPVRFVQ